MQGKLTDRLLLKNLQTHYRNYKLLIVKAESVKCL